IDWKPLRNQETFLVIDKPALPAKVLRSLHVTARYAAELFFQIHLAGSLALAALPALRGDTFTFAVDTYKCLARVRRIFKDISDPRQDCLADPKPRAVHQKQNQLVP